MLKSICLPKKESELKILKLFKTYLLHKPKQNLLLWPASFFPFFPETSFSPPLQIIE